MKISIVSTHTLVLLVVYLAVQAVAFDDDDDDLSDDDSDMNRQFHPGRIQSRSNHGEGPHRGGDRSGGRNPNPEPNRWVQPNPTGPPTPSKRLNENNRGQCQCMKPPGSNTCMPMEIDPSFQAASLEDALLNFDKPNELKPLAQPTPLSGPTKSGYIGKQINCGSSVCKRCAGIILADLERQSLEQGAVTRKTYKEIRKLKVKFQAVDNARDCPSLDLNERVRADQAKPVTISKADLAALEAKITGQPAASNQGKRIQTQPPDNNLLSSLVTAPTITKTAKNVKALSSEFASIYKLDCTGRGEVVEKGSVHMSLCSTCWQWGVLADDYYPQYVNLMTCQEDNRCLSGYGECRQRTRSVQVLKRQGNTQPPDYRPYSVDVPVCCDCQVKAGTALHNLVQG